MTPFAAGEQVPGVEAPWPTVGENLAPLRPGGRYLAALTFERFHPARASRTRSRPPSFA